MAKRPTRPAAGKTAEADDLGELPFEKALAELEEIVATLEDGSLALEESLARFERGIRLSRHLETQLRRAEARVRRLVGEDGETAELEELDADTGDEPDEEGPSDPRLPF